MEVSPGSWSEACTESRSPRNLGGPVVSALRTAGTGTKPAKKSPGPGVLVLEPPGNEEAGTVTVSGTRRRRSAS